MNNAVFWIAVAAYSAHILEEYSLDWRAWARDLSGQDLSREAHALEPICFPVVKGGTIPQKKRQTSDPARPGASPPPTS